MDTENDFENNNILQIFINILDDFLNLIYSKVIFKSNSLSINKKNQINIKWLLLNKTLHSAMSEIFSIKLWRNLTKFYPMTIISSDHENEIEFFRNHLRCPRILKMNCRNKWFNPPDNCKLMFLRIIFAEFRKCSNK